MKRKYGHLYCKSNEEEPEQPCLHIIGDLEVRLVKISKGKRMIPGMKINIDDADQHHQGAEESINEEFKCGGNPAFPTPLRCEEINRYQRQFPEKIKQEASAARNTPSRPACDNNISPKK